MKKLIQTRLKELRQESNMTQKQVAKVLSMSETGYASWEQGLSEPSIDAIIVLCKFYNVSADYLIGIEK